MPQNITDFYENAEIFLTGGSGVLGKAVLEKLLRSCNVHKIYILLRPKSGLTAEERLDKMRSDKIFDLLHKVKPNSFEKVVLIPGDVALTNLGITTDDAKKLENVSIILHSAATVRFDEPIILALKLNVEGTWKVIQWALTLKKLKMFMHVSTFYSNPYLNYVEPKLYSSPIDWRVAIKLLNYNTEQELFDVITKKLITGFPNTYTFTKNLAESLVLDYSDQLPIAIYRPSVVVQAMSEPVRGFPGGIQGAMGLFLLHGAGLMKSCYIGTTSELDLAPLDFGVKCMLYYTMRACREYRKGKPPVYILSSSGIHNQTFKWTCDTLNACRPYHKYPFLKSFLTPNTSFTSCRYYYMYLVFTKEIFSAVVADMLIRLFGQQPVLMSIVRRKFTTLKVLEPFLFNHYNTPGITEAESMHEELAGTDFDIRDDVLVACDPNQIGTVMEATALCVRRVLLKEDDSSLEKARKILKIKTVILTCFEFMWTYLALRLLYNIMF